MIWLARFAVFLAVLTTLWFNASYALSKAQHIHHQLGLVAAAVTIDLGKCTFLSVAAILWHQSYRVRALILFAIWPWLFLFSTFCGYAAITTNRAETTATATGHTQQQARELSRYEQLRADLATAQQSDLWKQTAGCAAPKLKQHRTYCANIKSLQQSLDASSNTLGAAPTVTPDPELATLHTVFQLTPSWLSLLVSLVPAILIELAASLGAYAVGPRFVPEPTKTPSKSFWQRLQLHPSPNPEPYPGTSQSASAAVPIKPPATTPSPSSPPAITWQIPKHSS